MMTTRTKLITAGLLAAAALALPACSVSETPGTATVSSADRDAYRAEQAAVTTANTPAVSTTNKYAELDKLVQASVRDAADFWDIEINLPVSAHAVAKNDGAHCASELADSRAWACASGAVVYDREHMLQLMDAPTGGAAVTLIMGHEVGHIAQHTFDPKFDTGSVLGERAASCSAGAYLRWVVDGKSDVFEMDMSSAQAAIIEAYPVEGDDGLTPENARIHRQQLTDGLDTGMPCLGKG